MSLHRITFLGFEVHQEGRLQKALLRLHPILSDPLIVANNYGSDASRSSCAHNRRRRANGSEKRVVCDYGS